MIRKPLTTITINNDPTLNKWPSTPKPRKSRAKVSYSKMRKGTAKRSEALKARVQAQWDNYSKRGYKSAND